MYSINLIIIQVASRTAIALNCFPLHNIVNMYNSFQRNVACKEVEAI